MPKITVIIPNYNHVNYLKQRIDSVLNQTYQDFEIIILDDYSSDDSRTVIELYRGHPKINHIIYNENNSGSTFKQWKKGINLAQGEYIWIAESDDFCENNFLEIAIDALKNENTDFFFCKTIRVDENGCYLDNLSVWYEDLNPKKWNFNYINSGNDEIRNNLIYKNTIVNASAVIFKNTNILQDHVNSILDFKYSGDWLLWLKILIDSKKIVYSIDTINYFRTHPKTTRDNVRFFRNYEILSIYKWIRIHLYNKKNNRILIKYYFENHIQFANKKNILNTIIFIIKSLKYSLHCPFYILKNTYFK